MDFISNANVQAGGPLLPNRLFYFGNVNNQQTHVNVPDYPAISPPQVPQITSGNDRDSTEMQSILDNATGVRHRNNAQSALMFRRRLQVTSKRIVVEPGSVKYNGVEIVATKRYSRGTTVLAGYTYSRETVERTSLENPNTAQVNADGISGGRRHNFKASGSATLPYRIVFGANFLMSSGQPITRTVSIGGCTTTITTGCLRQGAQTVNAEPRGSVELPGRYMVAALYGESCRRFAGTPADTCRYHLSRDEAPFAGRVVRAIRTSESVISPSPPVDESWRRLTLGLRLSAALNASWLSQSIEPSARSVPLNRPSPWRV